MRLKLKKIIPKILTMLKTPIIVIHTTKAVDGTLNADSGGSVSVTVSVPSGYSILAHINAWNTGQIGVICSFDAYTTGSTVNLWQNNCATVTRSRGTVHVLTLCVKNA